MASDSYEWTITDPQVLNRIYSAKVGDEFKSDIFQIEKINWQIELNPNGWNDATRGQFGVFIQPLTIPSKWKNIIVIRTIDSPQTYSKYTVPCIYTNHKSYGWSSGALSFAEIKQSKFAELIFVVKIKILQIRLQNNQLFYQRKFDYPHSQTLQWTIGPELMNKLDQSTVGKRVESPVYNQMWVIQLSPNGTNADTAGECRVVLHLCALPFGVSKMETQIVVSYSSINKKPDTKLITFSYEKPATFDTVCTFKEFRECDAFEINVNLLILKQFDNDNQEIEDVAAREWNQYIDDEKQNMSMDVGGGNHKIQQYIEDKFALYDGKLSALNNDIEQLSLKVSKIENVERKQDGNVMNAMNALKKEIEKLKVWRNNGNENDVDDEENKIKKWLTDKVELPQYYALFIENGFDDFVSIKQMSIDELQEIGVEKLGHRKKIMKFIGDLKYEQSSSSQPGNEGGYTPFI